MERDIYIYIKYTDISCIFTVYFIYPGCGAAWCFDLGRSQCAQHPVFAADVQDCAGLRMGWWRKSRISSIPQFEHKV